MIALSLETAADQKECEPRAHHKQEKCMFHVTQKRIATIFLAVAALFGAGGCNQGYAAAAAFGLGYLLGNQNSGQIVSTCFLNGAQVDCGSLPENQP